MLITKNLFAVLIIALALYPCDIFAQSYFVQKYSISNGLPTRVVYDVTQDSTGLMWFATNMGISSYDGFEFKNFSQKDNLPEGPFRKIKCDEKGIIWALPFFVNDTIAFYKDNHWQKLENINNKLTNNLELFCIDIIYKNDKPLIFAGTPISFYLYDGKWNLFDNYVNKEKLFVRNVFNDSGKFYLCTDTGLVVFNGIDFDNSYIKLTEGDPVYAGCFKKDKDGNNKIWLLGYGKVGYIQNNKYTLLTKTIIEFPITRRIEYSTLISTNDDKIIVGNGWGKFAIDLKTGNQKLLFVDQGFTTNSSTSIFCDRENNIWFTDTRGVDKFNSFNFENYFAYNGLMEAEVTAIAETKPGEFVFGHNNGLTLFNGKDFKEINFKDFSNYVNYGARVQDITVDKSGNIWFASVNMGIGKLYGNGSIQWFHFNNSFTVNSVVCDDNNNIYALASAGLFILKDNSFIRIFDENEILYLYRKLFNIDNKLFLAGISGIISVSGNHIKKYLTPTNIVSSLNVFTICKTKSNRLLAGCLQGLFEIKGDSVVKYTDSDIKYPVYAIKEDNTGSLWLGTNDGIKIISGTGTERHYSSRNGLVGDEVNRSALILDKEGRMWIGTEAGVSCYSFLHGNNVVPKVLLNWASDSKGNHYKLTEKLSIEYISNTLQFNFRAVSYINESLIQYKIKLDGYDEDWINYEQDGIGNIRYNNLKPGTYKFLVQAKNENSDWSQIYSSEEITINYPFYRSWWFAILLIAAFGFLFTIITKYFILKKYNVHLNKEIEERKIISAALKESQEKLKHRTDELEKMIATKDKFFSILAHDLRSPFTGLHGYSDILANEFDDFSDNDKRAFAERIHIASGNLLQLVNKLLQWSMLQTGKIYFNPKRININEVITSIESTLKINFDNKNQTFTNNIDKSICIFADRMMAEHIFRNLISNAMKFTPDGGKISVSSEVKNEFAFISVTDSGNGIPQEIIPKLFDITSKYSSKGTENEEGSGLGLILSKEMAEKNGGKITVRSIWSQGSTFTVELPICEND